MGYYYEVKLGSPPPPLSSSSSSLKDVSFRYELYSDKEYFFKVKTPCSLNSSSKF